MRAFGRTSFLLLLLAALGATAFYLTRTTSDVTSSIDVSDRQFAIKDRAEIAKIFIGQRNGKTITLDKKEQSWYTASGKTVHPNVINNMLDVLTGLRMKYIPPRSAYENMISAIGRNGIKVEVYNASGAQLKSYQVGGTTAGELGTVFIMDGALQPYVMELPYFEGSLRGRFLIQDEDQIRDRTVFAFTEDQIKEVSINYPKDQASSFRLVMDENKNYSVSPFEGDGYASSRKLRKGSVEGFLRAFQDVDAEAFENKHMLKDSIKGLVPIAEVKVTEISGAIKSIKMFATLDVFNKEINTRTVNVDKRVERYFVDCSWGDFMLVQHLLFRKILWKYDEFFE